MECKCSLDNNYEIIKLCDIETFNERIFMFSDKSWKQISLSEIIYIDNSYPDIEAVSKVYLDIKINSSKIINTPASQTANAEGEILTGKTLSISGLLKQKIIYQSDSSSTSITSYTFNTHFSADIIIDKDADPSADKYCVYPCVENIFLKPLDKRSLMKNINLFLFARKIVPETRVDIAVNSDKAEMSRITLSFDSKQIFVESTSELVPSIFNQNQEYFGMVLMSDNFKIKNQATLKGQRNAKILNVVLNEQGFSEDDIIKLRYKKNNNIKIINYMNQLNYTPQCNFEFFEIGSNELLPYNLDFLPNTISLKNINNDCIFTIQFISNAKILLLNPTGTTNKDSRFTFKIYDNSEVQLKLASSVNVGQTGDDILESLDNKQFDFGDILELEYSNNNLVEITNFPTARTPIYKPKANKEKFLITPTGLAPIYPNEIIIEPDGIDLGRVRFNLANNTLSVLSTGNIIDGRIRGEYLLSLILMNSSYFTKRAAVIFAEGNADAFRDTLNRLPYSYGDIIKLRSKVPGFFITNYKASSKHKILSYSEFISITPSGLIPANITYLPNKITLLNKDKSKVLDVSFVANARIFDLLTTENINLNSKFTFKLLMNDLTEKLSVTLSKGELGDSIIFLDDSNFIYNDIIELQYTDNSLIEISNFPNMYETYNPSPIKEKFIITPRGLEFYPPKLGTNIIIKNDIQEMSVISLNFLLRTFSVQSTKEATPASFTVNQEYFNMTLMDRNFIVKDQGRITGQQKADLLKASLNNESFSENDIVKLRFKNSNNIIITNYKNSAEYIPSGNFEFFKIGINHISPYRIQLLPNTIRLKNLNQSYILSVQFISNVKALLINPTINQNSDLIFTFRIYNDLETRVKMQQTINKNDFGDILLSLDNRIFEFGDILELEYSNNSLVEITNFPRIVDPVYNPKGHSEKFIITVSGLKPLYPNEIIIETEDVDIGKVKFNLFTNTLNVSSTGNSITFGRPNEYCLSLLLMDKFYQTTKQGIIFGDNNANEFKTDLNNSPYKYGDVIKLRSKVFGFYITNYKSQDKFMVTNYSEFMTITEQGLIPVIPTYSENSIKLSNNDSSEVLLIFFMYSTKLLDVHVTDEINRDSNFTFKLLDNKLDVKYFQEIIRGDSADRILALDNNLFQFYDIIELQYTNPSLVTINNFPRNPNKYNPTGRKEKFIITPNGLDFYPPRVGSNIVLNNNTSEVSVITLDFKLKKFKIQSTVNEAPPIYTKDQEYFGMVLMNETFDIKSQGSLNGETDTEFLKFTLNDKSFEENDIIKLRYKENNRLWITNFNQQAKYIPTDDFQFFKVGNGQLLPFNATFLQNTIRLKNSDDNLVLSIEFISNAKLLLINPTLTPNVDSTFTVKLYDNSETELKLVSIIDIDQYGDIMLPIDNKKFEYGDILLLEYSDNDLIDITNYPSTGSAPYKPKGSSEKFIITPSGLKPLYPNEILIETDGNDIGRIKLNLLNNTLNVSSTGEIIPGKNDRYNLSLLLMDDSYEIIKQGIILGNTNADKFKEALNDTPYNYGDIIKLRSKIIGFFITNYRSKDKYKINDYSEFMTITEQGLAYIQPSYLQSSINLANNDGEKVLDVFFIDKSKLLDVYVTDEINKDSTFTFKLLNNRLNQKYFQTIKQGSISDKFLPLDNNLFDFYDIIELQYTNPSLVTIENLVNGQDKYTPSGEKEKFILTPDGLDFYPPRIGINIVLNNNTSEVSVITLNFDLNKFKVQSTINQAPSIYTKDQEYFALVLMSETLDIKLQGSLNGKTDTDFLKFTLDNKDFRENDIIKLRFKENNRLWITNFNQIPKYIPIDDFQFFKVGNNSLLPFNITFLQNTIRLKNSDDDLVLSIEFISNAKLLLINPTLTQNLDSTFTVKLYDNSEAELKLVSVVDINDFGDIMLLIDNKKFEYGDILLLEYTDNTLVEITNYPTKESDPYSPKGTSEKFLITSSGLKPNN